MLKEFKQFLLRGNVVDLAVAVVVGAAFTAVIAAHGQGPHHPVDRRHHRSTELLGADLHHPPLAIQLRLVPQCT